MSDAGRLYIGGLNSDSNEQSLEQAFGKYGQISEVHVVRNRDSNESRGFGFITFENPGDARDAMEDMDGKYVHGRFIQVDRVDRPSGGGAGGRGRVRGRGYFQARGGTYQGNTYQ